MQPLTPQARRELLHLRPKWLARALSIWVGALFSLVLISNGARAEELPELARRWAAESEFSGSLLLARGTELLVSVNRGQADASGTPISDDTAFWSGSLSKQFAAVATLRLADRQQIDLQAPITRYFPELHAQSLAKDGVPCSVEHVLSHTCGLPREAGADPLYVADLLSNPARAQRLFSYLNQRALQFIPGTAFQYSNLGYALVGLLVQRTAGMPYEQFLQETFWGPLDMRHTGIQPRPGIVIARGQLSLGFAWIDAPRWLLFDPDSPAKLGASGNIYSTAADLLRWNYALHHGQLLQPSSYQSLIQPRREDYGLGIATSQKPFGKALFHMGALAPHSTSSLLVYVPERDLSLVAVSNHPVEVARLSDFGNALISALAHTPTDVVAGPPAASKMLLAALPALVLLGLSAAILAGLWRYCRRRERFSRWGWWFRYHCMCLALAITLFRWRDLSIDPWLLAGCALALLVAVRQRWWLLPQAVGGNRARAYIDLVSQLAIAALLVWLSPWSIVISFAATCVIPGLLFAGLRWTQSAAHGSSSVAARS